MRLREGSRFASLRSWSKILLSLKRSNNLLRILNRVRKNIRPAFAVVSLEALRLIGHLSHLRKRRRLRMISYGHALA